MSVTITVNGTDYDVPSSAADTNWAAEQVAFEQALTAQVNTNTTNITTNTSAIAANTSAITLLQASTWANITDGELQNSWAGAGVNQRLKRPWGDVMLRMHIDSGTNGTICYTLPTGYRPAYLMYFICSELFASAPARITIDTNGDITVFAVGAGNPSTDGIAIDVVFSTNA